MGSETTFRATGSREELFSILTELCEGKGPKKIKTESPMFCDSMIVKIQIFEPFNRAK